MAIEFKKSNDKSIVSEEIQARILGMKSWVYAAVDTDANDWCAYLVLSMAENTQDMLQLHELFVRPAYRRQLIGSGLMNHAFLDAVHAGARRIFYKDIRDGRGLLWENYSFCESQGFRLLVADEMIDSYDAAHLAENGNIKSMVERHKRFQITKFLDYQDLLLKKLQRRLACKHFFLQNDSFDIKHSRFYLKDGEVIAAAFVQSISPSQAVLTGIYIDKDCQGTNKDLITLMLTLHCIESILSTGYQKLYILAENNRHRNIRKELIGEPDGVHYAAEWIKELFVEA